LPNKATIETIHNTWYGNYELLDKNYDYIQWLFPIREEGVNEHAKPLQLHEIEEMKKDPIILDRFMKSYKLMLGFYGLQLLDESTGEIAKSVHYNERIALLSKQQFQYFKLTRILKSLGEIGLERLKPPFVKFFLDEIYIRKNPNMKNSLDSCLNYWIPVIRNTQERHKLMDYVDLKSRGSESNEVFIKLDQNGLNDYIDTFKKQKN